MLFIMYSVGSAPSITAASKFLPSPGNSSSITLAILNADVSFLSNPSLILSPKSSLSFSAFSWVSMNISLSCFFEKTLPVLLISSMRPSSTWRFEKRDSFIGVNVISFTLPSACPANASCSTCPLSVLTVRDLAFGLSCPLCTLTRAGIFFCCTLVLNVFKADPRFGVSYVATAASLIAFNCAGLIIILFIFKTFYSYKYHSQPCFNQAENQKETSSQRSFLPFSVFCQFHPHLLPET